jgi:hypothetical protein
MITETDEVGAALDRVRSADPDGAVNLSELVVLGANRKVELLEETQRNDERRTELRERFLQRTRSGEGVDWDALADVHQRGWVHTTDG